jgi:dTDP-4-dehydrorhamnose reductase
VRVVVLGASGQLGQDLMRIFGAPLSATAIGLGHQEIDVSDGVALTARFQELRPDWVINTAAFHRVDDCEVNPTLAFAVNALGAGNVARAAAAAGAGVVFFSSDYVFGGGQHGRGQPYAEADPPRPLNVYGVSKLAGEQLVALGNPRHLVVRTAGLYGTTTSRKGWTFPELMLHKARTDGAVRVVTDQALSPTFTADLAEAVKTLVERDMTGLVHLTNAGECSWYELAAAVFELTGVAVKLDAVESSAFPTRARRPPYSALTSSRLVDEGIGPLRPWREALADYLHQKGER